MGADIAMKRIAVLDYELDGVSRKQDVSLINVASNLIKAFDSGKSYQL